MALPTLEDIMNLGCFGCYICTQASTSVGIEKYQLLNKKDNISYIEVTTTELRLNYRGFTYVRPDGIKVLFKTGYYDPMINGLDDENKKIYKDIYFVGVDFTNDFYKNMTFSFSFLYKVPDEKVTLFLDLLDKKEQTFTLIRQNGDCSKKFDDPSSEVGFLNIEELYRFLNNKE